MKCIQIFNKRQKKIHDEAEIADGTKAMIDHVAGVVTRIKKVSKKLHK